MKGVHLRWFAGGAARRSCSSTGWAGRPRTGSSSRPSSRSDNRVHRPGPARTRRLGAVGGRAEPRPFRRPPRPRARARGSRPGGRRRPLARLCRRAAPGVKRSPSRVRGLVLFSAAGIGSSSRRARQALWLSSLVRPGRFLAPHRARIARSERLRALVWGSWATPDGTAISPLATEGLLEGPALHTDTGSAAIALASEDPRLDLERVRCPACSSGAPATLRCRVDDAFEYARRLRRASPGRRRGRAPGGRGAARSLPGRDPVVPASAGGLDRVA